MTAIKNPAIGADLATAYQNILITLIPEIWKQAFIAPMAIHGDYDTVGIKIKGLPGANVQMWKNQLEITYKDETWTCGWDVGRPWHVTGGWLFSSNWRHAGPWFPKFLAALTEHSIKTTRICTL